MNYIKSGYLRLDDDDIYILENYCKKWGIKGAKWYKDDWFFEEEKENNKEQIERIKNLRETIITPLVKLKADLSNNKTIGEISKKVYEFLIENKVDKILLSKKVCFENEGYVENASELELAWNIIINVLDELESIFGDEKTTFDKYIKLLRIGLNASGLGIIPQTQDQIVLGDIERSRSSRVKAVFILGMNDGMFPSVHKSEGFLSDEDRTNLKKKGIELAKTSLDALYEDNFSIYKALTTPEEKLYCSYPASNLEGAALRPSILVNKIKKIFPKLIEESELSETEDALLIENSCFDELIKNLSRFKNGEEIDKKWFVLFNYFYNSKEWKNKLESSIKALDYTNKPEKISKENVDKLYGNTLNTTVSRLEKYKSCPFSYYLKYGLKVNDVDTFKVKPIDTGNFMHDVIDTFFKTVRERNINIKEIEDSDTQDIINEIIDEKLSLSKNYIFTSTDKYKVLTRRLKRVIQKSIKYIIEGLKQSDFQIYGTELEFKKGKEYEPITLMLEDGKKVEITGKIDRIDLAKNEEGSFIRIIDYKSSVKNIDLNEVIYGLQLQLLTYLDATCKIEEMMPAGVLYFSLIDPIIKSNKYMEDQQIEEELKKKFKMNGLILADVKVVKMMDNSLESGQSSIIPAYIDKDGNLSKKSNAVTKEQFEDLQRYTTKIIKEISNEILSGNIDITPYYNVKNKKTPCDYCEYKMICGFKPGVNKNNYNYIGKEDKEELLKKIKERKG